MCPICPGCARETGGSLHFCHPAPQLKPCPVCGRPSLSGHLCPEKIRKVRFVCLRCGRFSEDEASLCGPVPLFPE